MNFPSTFQKRKIGLMGHPQAGAGQVGGTQASLVEGGAACGGACTAGNSLEPRKKPGPTFHWILVGW